ncbi:MAG: hypothetical protein ICV75_07950 [Nitrospiraceae bacterium]|nr:hypothetical protein [Nitrospiraceae bacterium]
MWTAIRLFMTGSDGVAPIGWESALLRFDKVIADKAYVILALVSLCGIGLLGLFSPATAPKMRVLWWAATLNLLFAVSYGINDRFTFFLPGAALYAVLGVAFMFRRSAVYSRAHLLTLALILVHPLILVSTAVLASSGWITLPAHPSKLPFRDDTTYYLSPYIPDRSAAAFVHAYEEQVPEGSAVLADYTPMGALRSAQVIGQFLHRDLIQCDETGLTDEARRQWPKTMYLVRKSYCEAFTKEYKAEPTSIGWIVSR